MKKLIHNGKTMFFTRNDEKVAMILCDLNGVGMLSDFTEGTGRHTKSLYPSESFTCHIWNEEWSLEAAPKFVQLFARKHPRAQKFIYWTKPRLVKKIANLL